MKNGMKKILAFLCAVVLVVTTVLGNSYMEQAQAEDASEVTPVTLEGFKNVTVKDFKDGSGNSMPEQTYTTSNTKASFGYSAPSITNFDKVMLSLYVKFGQLGSSGRLYFGGTAATYGFAMHPNGGDNLFLWDYSDVTGTDLTTDYLPPKNVGLSTYNNTEFLLQVAMEFGDFDSDGGSDDVKMYVYVQGQQWGTEPRVITNCDMNQMGNYIGIYVESGKTVTVRSVDIPTEAVVLDGFMNVSVDDFVDGSGNQMTEGTYDGAGRSIFNVPNLANFDKVLLSMYVTFGTNDGNSRIEIGGGSDGKGLAVWVNGGGNLLFADRYGFITTETWTAVSLTPSEAKVESFKNQEFLLQLSIEYGNFDSDSTGTRNDVKLGVYIDGVPCSKTLDPLCNWNIDKTGKYLSVCREGASNSMTVRNVELDTLAGFDELTIKDFQDEDGNEMEAKKYDSSKQIEWFSAPDYENKNFDNTAVSMNVMFLAEGTSSNRSATRINVGGADKGVGLMVYPRESGTKLDVYAAKSYTGISADATCRISASTAGLTSFLDTKFQLQLTFNFVDVNDTATTADLLVRVYINGKLSGTVTFADCSLSKFGNYIGMYRELEESAICVGSINGDFPCEQLTFFDFGILDKTYEKPSETQLAVTGQTSQVTTLAETMISGDIQLDCSQDSKIIWGGQSSGKGLCLQLNGSKGFSLYWFAANGTNSQVTKLTPEVAGVTFAGETYKLGLSTECVMKDADGKMNDIKVGIWFNGKLYNNQYFYIADGASELGNYFSVYCTQAGDSVTFNSDKVMLAQQIVGYEQVTFSHYGIDDGTYAWYEAGAGVNAEGSYKKDSSINKTVLCGDILLTRPQGSKDSFNLVLGGTSENLWNGLVLNVSDSGNLFLNASGTTLAKIAPAKVGLSSFIGEKFYLMWSVETGELDDTAGTDTKVGIWINGTLCNGDLSGTYAQEYIVISGYGDSLGNRFGVAGSGEEDTVTLNSVYELTGLPDKSFGKITFSDFGLENGEYDLTTDTVKAKGQASKYTKFDGVAFSGDIRISDAGSQTIIYGGDGGWNGLRLILSSSGNWNTYWYLGSDGTFIETIIPAKAGLTSFTQETFNLMISTELVDNNGVGGENDIKICLWFNEMRYTFEDGNDYFIVNDKGDSLKNGFGIVGKTGTSVLLRSVAEYQQNPYYYAEISEYRGDSGYTYPTLEGHVFSGWYEDEDYTTWIDPEVKSGDAYAKFVKEDVLSAKPQIKLDSNNQVPTDTTDLRFVTTVDSLEYRQVSFFIKKGDNPEKDAATVSDENAKVVYEKLYYVGSESTMEYKPNVFSWMSTYFKSFTLKGIPSDGYGTMIQATPYWITMDGTTVRGETLKTCVDYYKPSSSSNKSVAASIDFLGAETMPITGFHGPNSVTHATDSLLFPNFVTDEYVKMIADSGVNVISCSNLDYASKPALVKKLLELGEKYGVGIYVQDSAILTMTDANTLKARIAKYSGYESFVGMYLVDEPKTDSYKSDSSHGHVNAYKTTAELLTSIEIPYYVNLYPVVDEAAWSDWFTGGGLTTTEKNKYNQYVEDVYGVLSPDVLSWDMYPFTGEDDVETSVYFWNMDAIRTKAINTKKPFWAYVQAGSHLADGGKYITDDSYYPNEYQLNWNVNTSLAFGAQGISYFPLVQPTDFAYGKDQTHWDFNRNSLLGAWGNKTEWYTYAQSINEHIGEIDSVLMNSVNEGVIATGSAATDTSGLNSIISSSSYGTYKLQSVPHDVMIGCFDYNGKTALYVVNYSYEAAKDITLGFTGTYDVKTTQNATTSRNDDVSSLTLNMKAGEGVLLVIE